uniref:Uncharacterized protein n=1 Tax=Romanomermis culicivorax TaxID=13658 RepID=A0A915JSN9_ROMCU
MLLYKSLKSMAVMMASVECGGRLLMIVMAVVLAVAVIMIIMRVAGIVMTMGMNGARVAIAAIVGGIAAAGRRSESL